MIENGRINFDINIILKVGKKSNNVCAKCGNNENLCIHHIHPLHLGGNNDINNLVLLCGFCHKLVHKNKGELYNEEDYYSQENTFNSRDYFIGEIGWKMNIDGTDHFEFLCPKCKCPAVISKIELRGYNSLNTPPCFYFFLKCPRCKIGGQRKGYVNYPINEINKIKEVSNG